MWEHPCDQFYRRLLLREREKRKVLGKGVEKKGKAKTGGVTSTVGGVTAGGVTAGGNSTGSAKRGIVATQGKSTLVCKFFFTLPLISLSYSSIPMHLFSQMAVKVTARGDLGTRLTLPSVRPSLLSPSLRPLVYHPSGRLAEEGSGVWGSLRWEACLPSRAPPGPEHWPL